MIAKKTDIETFFGQAPRLNPNVSKITGVISREAAAATAWRRSRTHSSQVRYLDKLVDELAKGKAMDKILRKCTGSVIKQPSDNFSAGFQGFEHVLRG